MTLETYLQLKRNTPLQKTRELCHGCRHAKSVCDCQNLRPFHSATEFILLMHPEESRRRIATGRLTHLWLKNSQLLTGESFEQHKRLDQILSDPDRQVVTLYPGPKAVDLSETDRSWRDTKKKLTVLVLDGTWRTAKKMLRLTPKLHALEQICFQPPHLSRFRIRKQPADICFSTLEAVHHILQRLEPETHERDRLIEAFDFMVERQIAFEKTATAARDQNNDKNSHNLAMREK